MSEELIRFDKVDICYDGQQVVKNMSFSIEKGEILGIVGESGSGKSTVLKAAIGLLGKGGLVTSGNIYFQNNNILDLSEKEFRKICGPELGMIFQYAGDSFCPIRTIEKQLYDFMKEHQKISKQAFNKKATEMFTKIGFKNPQRVLESYPFELSGGMQQRVGIAAAMLLNPKLLLADEPTSALDVSVQKQVVEEMILMRKLFGTSILLVTHNLGVIKAMADKVLIMKDGEVVEYGVTERVLSNPQQEYTKKLMAAVPKIRR